MDFKGHLETAWRLTLRFLVALILMTLVMSVLSIITLGILWPVTLAGYIHAILLMVREGREPKLQDLFSQMRLFFPLLGFTIGVILITLFGFLLLILPGLMVLAALSFFCLYMLPLMTDKGMGVMEAIRESYSMSVKGPIVDHIILVILFLGISALGSSVFIGWLFTQPLATVLLLSVYEEKIRS